MGGDWALYEDKKDRPGWIATKEKSVIRFPVRLGAAAIISVTYLRSYEGVGRAEGVIEVVGRNGQKASHPQPMEGLWERNYSLPHTQLFYAAIPGINDVLN